MFRRCVPVFVLLALLGLGCGSAWADPPGRVGRLAYSEGAVSLYSPDLKQWSPAPLNYPVTTGATLWTDANSRAEIQVGPSEIRMDHGTELVFQQIDDNAVLITVPQGVVNVHLHSSFGESGFQVVTPGGQMFLVKAGAYHVDAGTPDASGGANRLEVNVLEGEARFAGLRSTLDIQPGEGAVFSPNGFGMIAANATEFDNWALMRDRQERATAALNYVPADMTGYQQLDQAGSWVSLPDYGTAWMPSGMPADWAPYRYGHWAFVPPWGWTWIDDAPWGFAPFHYGRWIMTTAGWAWCPGPMEGPPVYAPALVTFLGGDGWSVTFASAGPTAALGWVPLGPREHFHPYYNASSHYAERLNHNWGPGPAHPVPGVGGMINRGAATVVPAAAFVNGAPVHRATLSVPLGQTAQAPITHDLGHLSPSPASRAGLAVPQAAHATVPAPGTPAAIVPQRGDPMTTHQPAGLPQATQGSQAHPGAIPQGATPQARPAEPTHTQPAIPEARTVPQAAQPRSPQPHWAGPETVREVPAGGSAVPTAAPALPDPVRRPQQQAPLQATPQGWTRAPQAETRQAPQPQAAPRQAPAPQAAAPRPQAPASQPAQHQEPSHQGNGHDRHGPEQH